MTKALYICYFGVDQPLVHTQVIPYLRELVNAGHGITLLTFESAAGIARLRTGREAEIRNELAASGITWHWLKYHKRLSVLATAYDILVGSLFVGRELSSAQVPEILHARAHVPALIAALARKLSTGTPKVLFDIRGFMPEEYTDAGLWAQGGWLYRIAKRVEAWLMSTSDGFVVLTESAREMLFPESREHGFDRRGRPVEVIPCCVDFDERFSSDEISSGEAMRNRLGLRNRFVITHVGALGGVYLSDEIVDFLGTAKTADPKVFALFLTQSASEEIINLLRSRGFSDADFFVSRVSPREVRSYLEACDVGLSFVRTGFAGVSRSPTKIPEYLAAGLPVIANSGIGDVDALLSHNRIGVSIKRFDGESYRSALEAAREMGVHKDRCREVAKREFDLKSIGGKRYRRLYSRLVQTSKR